VPRFRFLAHPIVAFTLVSLISSGVARAQNCTNPGACSGTPVLVTFESLAPGYGVEGLGALHPALSVQSVTSAAFTSCTPGSAKVIEEGLMTPYEAYTTSTTISNDCLNGIRGFADDRGCVLDYVFHIAPGYSVSCFSLLMVDYGDLFPFGGSSHQVVMTAYDASNVVVDTYTLSMSGGVDLSGGDACVAQAGSPGRTTLFVTGAGIRKVTLKFAESPDPNIGFDDLSFCLHEDTVPVDGVTWSSVKSRFDH
jgi:hypothetical protein